MSPASAIGSERALVDTPASPGGPLAEAIAVLWHGAGGDVNERTLAATAAALAAAGAIAVRARFPYRLAGRRAPDRMPVLLESARTAIDEARTLPGALNRKLVLGGRSMGGRVASMLVASGAPADGLVFLSYPLHPAGRPDNLRDQHLPRIPCPMLFVQGDKDALCSLDLLRPVLDRLGARAELAVFRGADHGMRRADADEVARTVVNWTARAVQRAAVLTSRKPTS